MMPATEGETSQSLRMMIAMDLRRLMSWSPKGGTYGARVKQRRRGLAVVANDAERNLEQGEWVQRRRATVAVGYNYAFPF